MTDLWVEASYDYDAERRARSLEMAKAASQGTWAFLALAQSPEEYKDRLALASDQIVTAARANGVDVHELVNVFDQRFALLMEAKDNPFNDSDDDDTDDSDDDGADDSPDNGQDDEDSDDSDDDDDTGDGADDVDDQTDPDGDGDQDNADDSSKGKSLDPDQEEDEAKGKSQGISPWASRYASLAKAIEAGEDPLTWGSAPFVHSSARKEAADGAAQVSDVNTPQPDPGGMEGASVPPEGAPSAPGMGGGIPETTKPRQLPGSDAPAPGMGMDAIADPMMDPQFDPAMNGGDIQQGADDLPPATSAYRSQKVAAIAREVRRYNPTLSARRCRKVAEQVFDQYLHKHAEDMNPLLFGDRANVPDGPATQKVKNWSPQDFKPGQSGGESGSDGGDGGGGGGGGPKVLSPSKILPGKAVPELPAAAEGAGAAATVGEAAELLPLLAL